MLSENLPLFLGTAAILTMAPGLDTAIVLRTAATGGARQGAFASLGIAIGCLCWGAAAAFGLGALLKTWPLLFDMLRTAGAIYLAWLGGRLLLHPRRAFELDDSAVGTVQSRSAIRTGFVTNILNPKVGLFYLTLLPQFVPHGGSGWHAFGLASLHVLIAFAWFLFLSALTGGIRPWLRRPSVMGALDRVTGGIFVLLGLQLTLTAAPHI